jgi:hypothetical protein
MFRSFVRALINSIQEIRNKNNEFFEKTMIISEKQIQENEYEGCF